MNISTAGAVLPDWEATTDVVVVGTGVAGLTCALGLTGLRVLVVTKERPTRRTPRGRRAVSPSSATSATPATVRPPTRWSPGQVWAIRRRWS